MRSLPNFFGALLWFFVVFSCCLGCIPGFVVFSCEVLVGVFLLGGFFLVLWCGLFMYRFYININYLSKKKGIDRL